MDQWLMEQFKNRAKIGSADSRGFYITTADPYTIGTFYLYDDGVIRDGATSDEKANAFWESHKSAVYFLNQWQTTH